MFDEDIKNILAESHEYFIKGIEEGIKFSVPYFFKDIHESLREKLIEETIDKLVSIKKSDLIIDSIKK